MKKFLIIFSILFLLFISCFCTYNLTNAAENKRDIFDSPLTKAGTKPWSKGK